MVDELPPAQMARWLRETAQNTRARGNAPWTENETRVAAHVAFRLEQAADQLERLSRPYSEREPPHCPTCSCGMPTIPQQELDSDAKRALYGNLDRLTRK